MQVGIDGVQHDSNLDCSPQIRITLEPYEIESNMKTIVTGATNGLGAAAASQLASQGHRLLLIARDKARGEAKIASLRNNSPAAVQQQHTLYLADLSCLSSVKRVACEIRRDESSIDVLINNAGNLYRDRRITPEGIESTIAVNHFTSFVLTLEPAVLLTPGSRVVNMAGEEHRRARWDGGEDLLWEKTEYGNGFPVYWPTKLYNILFTLALAARWAERGVSVNCLHPGMTATIFGAGQLGSSSQR